MTEAGHETIRVSASKPDREAGIARLTVLRELDPAEVAHEYRRARLLELQEKQRRAAKRRAEKAALKASARTIPFNQLEKNPARYKGDPVTYRGQILQIEEDGGSTWMLLSVTDEGYGIWSDEVWVDYAGKIPQAREDVVEVWGRVTGRKDYENRIGGFTSAPRVRAKYIESG